LHIVELQAAIEEVDVRVVKPGQDEVLASVDYAGIRTAPAVNIKRGTDGHNAAPDHRQGFGARAHPVHRVKPAVGDDEVGRGASLGAGNRHQEHEDK
jgi:hypothetical protein